MTASQILLPGNSEEPKGHTYFWDIHPPRKNGEGDLARSLSRFPKCHHLDPISFLSPRVRLCNVGPFKDRNCQRHSPLWESNWWLTREAIVLHGDPEMSSNPVSQFCQLLSRQLAVSPETGHLILMGLNWYSCKTGTV